MKVIVADISRRFHVLTHSARDYEFRKEKKMKKDHKTIMLALLFLSLTLIVNSCGGGGGSSPGNPPYIIAELNSFPTGSVPPGLMPDGSNSMAAVYVIDDYSGAPIPNASVSMNGVTLTYDATYQNYGGYLTVAPGESFALSVTVGGNTCTASGTQFTSYPTIAAPAFGASWPTGYDSSIVWSEGTPTTMTYYTRARSLLGILDAADPNGPLVWPSDGFLVELYSPTTSSLIPANSLTVGNRHVIVGIGAFTPIANAAVDSRLYLAGFSSVPITVTNATLVSIEVTPSDPSIAKGRTQQFAATGTFSDNSVRDLTDQVAWASSKPWVTTFDPGHPGLAGDGGFVGTATITARLGDISGSTTLTVTPATLVSIEIYPWGLYCGTVQQFDAYGKFSDNTELNITSTVTWSSSDTSVVAISNAPGSNGLATSLAGGITTVTAASDGIVGTRVLGVASLVSTAVSPENPTIAIGATQQFTAMGKYSNGNLQDLTTSVTWNSSNTGIATISNTSGLNGKSSSVNNGTTTITASVCDVSGSTTLAVPTWTVRNTAASDLQSVAWSGSNFVSVGNVYNQWSLPWSPVFTSPDGITWTPRSPTSLDADFLSDVIWAGSQFMAVGFKSAMATYSIFTSPDGVTWTGQDPSTRPYLYGITWSGTQFAATGDFFIYSSPDGTAWTRHQPTAFYSTPQSYRDIVWSGSKFVAVGSLGISVTSPDGLAWTEHYSGISDSLYGIAWSGTQFVAVGESGKILTSSDGATWTLRASGTSSRLEDVVWSGTQFVAVGQSGTIITSSDGVTWAPWYSGVTIDLHGITWSGSQYVVVGKSIIITSPESF